MLATVIMQLPVFGSWCGLRVHTTVSVEHFSTTMPNGQMMSMPITTRDKIRNLVRGHLGQLPMTFCRFCQDYATGRHDTKWLSAEVGRSMKNWAIMTTGTLQPGYNNPSAMPEWWPLPTWEPVTELKRLSNASVRVQLYSLGLLRQVRMFNCFLFC